MKEAFELIRKRIEEIRTTEQFNRGKMLKENDYTGANIAHRGIVMLNDAISIVSEVEEEYGNGWIDVKDRLPENDGYYLTCDHKGNIHVFYHHPSYVTNGRNMAFGICKNHPQFYKPIAWMELPKPYTRKKGV